MFVPCGEHWKRTENALNKKKHSNSLSSLRQGRYASPIFGFLANGVFISHFSLSTVAPVIFSLPLIPFSVHITHTFFHIAKQMH